MRLEMVTPTDYVGNLMDLANGRRGGWVLQGCRVWGPMARARVCVFFWGGGEGKGSGFLNPVWASSWTWPAAAGVSSSGDAGVLGF